MSLPVVVLAGGLATRLRPVTATVPKALVDVAGRPFAEHQIELLRRHGLTEITFLVSHMGEVIRDTLGDGSRWGARLKYLFDGPRRLGTGGAIAQALPSLGEAFFVVYGDSYLECDYEGVAKAFEDSGRAALMTVFRNDGRWDQSNVLFEGGRIVQYDKAAPSSDMRHIDYGLGAFRCTAFAQRPKDVAFDLADVYRELLDKGELAGYEVTSRFYEIGSPEGLEETRAFIACQDPTPSVRVRRRAVFLDRDGIINRAVMRDGKPYPPDSVEQLDVTPGALEALSRLKSAGYVLIVVTNQPDVARGTQLRSVVDDMHRRLGAELPLDDWRVCFHDDRDHCDCRKPKPGLLLDAAEDLAIDVSASVMIGDRWRDIEAGRRAGCRTVFIDNGYNERKPDRPDAIVTSLPLAVDWILSDRRSVATT